MKQKIIITLSIAAMLLFPLIGAYLYFDGNFPPDFFNFPPLTPLPKPDFSLSIFIILSLIELFVVLFYLAPSLFGFKKSTQYVKITKQTFPWWFWIGLLILLPTISVLWAHLSSPKFWIENAYIFVFFSLILIIDGFVYHRNEKKSMLSLYAGVTLILAFASAISWLFFEYLNFFVGENWYYPLASQMSKLSFNIYAFVGAATLAPTIFEVYTLLKTFPKLANRYKKGLSFSLKPRIVNFLFILSILLLFFLAFFPNLLFPYLWVGPLLILSLLLIKYDIPNPFTKIKVGDWSPLMLMALSGFIMGLLWEGNNYMSAVHHPFNSYVPGYWIYNIAYVNIVHVFEMPVLGLMGYLPYGLNNWIWWIVFSKLINNKKLLNFEF